MAWAWHWGLQAQLQALLPTEVSSFPFLSKPPRHRGQPSPQKVDSGKFFSEDELGACQDLLPA